MQTQQPSFYWHDYETWGLSPSLDRPSQFAGIRTDMDFNIISEQPEMFYCRLSNDYLPNPESAIITGITPEITQQQGIPEFEFARRINQQFSQTNTCVVGYNSIRFDEEFSRNIFYRNFYDPYEYSWKNGNSRWDIIDLVRATYALRPDGINWPQNEQGLPSFRLELLTEANGISHESAHDATSDVYATIALAQLIQQKSPKIFNYYFNLRNKNKLKDLIDVKNKTPLVHVSGMFGSKRGNTSLVAPLIWHPTNTNAVVVIDLAKDITPVLALSADEIRERLYTKHDDLGDKTPIPLKLIHINKCPFLAVEKTLRPENAERLGIDRKACWDNLEILKAHSKLSEVVTEVYQQQSDFDNKGNVDAMLYDSFFSNDDRREFSKIRDSKPEDLAKLNLMISDSRFENLFIRYRARNFPNTLTNSESEQWASHCHAVITSIKEEYFSNLNSLILKFENDEKKKDILNGLWDYAKTIAD